MDKITQEEIDELKQRNAELSSKVKSLVSQLWRFRKIFRSDTYDAVSSAKSLREVAMIVDFSVEQMLAEHDREVASRAVERVKQSAIALLHAKSQQRGDFEGSKFMVVSGILERELTGFHQLRQTAKDGEV